MHTHQISLTPPHVSCACPKSGIVLIGLSLCSMFYYMYIFDNIQFKATFLIQDNLTLFRRSGIHPGLRTLGDLRFVNPLCLSRVLSAVFWHWPIFFIFILVTCFKTNIKLGKSSKPSCQIWCFIYNTRGFNVDSTVRFLCNCRLIYMVSICTCYIFIPQKILFWCWFVLLGLDKDHTPGKSSILNCLSTKFNNKKNWKESEDRHDHHQQNERKGNIR